MIQSAVNPNRDPAAGLPILPQQPGMANQTIHARTESHSDVAASAPAKAYQAELTERKFGDQIVRQLRTAPGGIQLRNLQEDWISVEGGLVHELKAELELLD